jgi:hypothetical protein
MFEGILDSTDEIVVEPVDYVVFSAYILAEFREFKIYSKGDVSVEITFAKNLGKIARIGHRFLEISIASSLKRREEARQTAAGAFPWGKSKDAMTKMN